MLATRVAAIGLLLTMAGVLAIPPFAVYAYIPCPGSETCSGYVYDQEGSAIYGVYVSLYTGSPYQGGSASGWTNTNGHFSVTMSNQCPAHASFYWVGDSEASGGTNGPLLLSKYPVSQTYSPTVNVWETSISANLFYEYPDVPNSQVQVSATTGGSFTLGVQAKVTGGIDVGFLSAKVGGQVGTDLTLSSTYSYSATHSSPYQVYWNLGTAIKVVDTSGNSIVYVRQSPISTLQSAGISSDWQTVSGAIASGRYTWIKVAPSGQDTQGWGVTTTVTVSAQVDVEFTAFGNSFQLTTTFSGDTSSSFTNTAILTNPSTTQDSCFLLYWEGSAWTGSTTSIFDLHVLSQKYINLGSSC